MAISEMQRVYVIGHMGDRDEVMRKLQAAGAMEIDDIGKSISGSKEISEIIGIHEPSAKKADIDAMVANLRYGIDTLVTHAPKKNLVMGLTESLVEGIFGAKRCITREEWEDVGGNLSKYLAVCEQCRDLYARLGKLKGERAKLSETRVHLTVIRELRHPLERFGTTGMLVTQLGSVDSKHFEVLRSDLSKADTNYMEKVSSAGGRQYLLLTFLREDEAVMEELLKTHDFRRMSTAGFIGTPAEIIRGMDKRLEGIELERAEINKSLEALAKNRENLLVAHDYLSVQKMAADAEQCLGRTETTFTVQGWARKADIDTLRKSVAGAAVIEREPMDGETPPVMLENSPMFRPFQVVTNIYGKPKYSEIDPSAFIAPFFLLFFALCLADAAYGIVLLVGCAVAYHKIPSGRRFFKLMMACSVFTIIIGFLMGGFLGNNLVRIKAVWIDPLEDPATFLIFALALGVLHTVYVGPGVKMYMNMKSKRYSDAILDQVTWMVFITSLMLFGLSVQGLLGATLGRVFMLDSSTRMFLDALGASLQQHMIAAGAISAILIVLTRNREQKFGARRIVSGLANLYGVTGYMSDILSYSRILALGMGTAVIAVVVNELAFMAMGIQGVGIILAIMVLIVGHTFNIVMGTLGAFVHTARLQFIEFFGKFMEGGGRTFKPFCERKKYVEIK